MSYMKREIERDDPLVAALRCQVCGVEAMPGMRGVRRGDDGWVCPLHTREAAPQ